MTKSHCLCFISRCLITNSSSKMIKNLKGRIIRVPTAHKKSWVCTTCFYDFVIIFFRNGRTRNTCVSYSRLIPCS